MATLVLLLLLLPAPAHPAPARLVLLHDAPLTHGARCLDGSPPGVYIRDTHPGNPWIIAQDGGGWCYNESSCYERSLTPLGSSTSWPATREGVGLEDDNCTNNPAFCLSLRWPLIAMAMCVALMGTWHPLAALAPRMRTHRQCH